MQRPYKISVWSHNDNFLSVIGDSNEHYRGEIFNPVFTRSLKSDIVLTFSIPLNYFDQETETWVGGDEYYNSLVEKGVLVNERKVKYTEYNNDGSIYKIYEFVITNIQESRSGEQLLAEITCSGLAFQDLGKKGHAIIMDIDTVELEEIETGEIVKPTLNYWCDKLFPKKNGILQTNWTYRIEMDYSNFQGSGRRSDRIYESDDVESWEEVTDGAGNITELKPIYGSEPIEKMRFPDISESNIFNITQDLAELFGVFARYEFEYGDKNNPYKITNRIVVFYNDIIQDTEYAITYADNLVGFTRDANSENIYTKMYVDPIDSDNTDLGYISISDVVNNKLRDNFILNFDYYIQSGQLSERQLAAIPQFELALRTINNRIIAALDIKYSYDNTIRGLETQIQIINDKIAASQTTMNDYIDKVAAINSSLSTYILTDTKVASTIRSEGGKRFVTPRRVGVISNTLTVMNSSGGYIPHTKQIDSYGYVTQVNITDPNLMEGTVIYLTYNYDILSFYRNEIYTYETSINALTYSRQRLEQELGEELSKNQDQYGNVYDRYRFAEENVTALQEERLDIIREFEKLMGYYIREGKWVTDGYVAPLETKNLALNTFYDDVPFFEEEVSHYYYTAQEWKMFCNYIIVGDIVNNIDSLNNLVLYETWSQSGTSYTKQYMINAHYTPQIMNIGGTPTFVFLFAKGEEVVSGHSLYYRNRNGNNVNITNRYQVGGSEIYGVSIGNTYPLLYKRAIIVNEDVIPSTVKVTSNGVILNEFHDYFIMTRGMDTYIALKINDNVGPELGSIQIEYKADRTAVQYYFDALDASLQAAYPETSYDVNFIYLRDALNPHHTFTIDDRYEIMPSKINDNLELELGNIVRIYDSELGLRGLKGIVNEISISLDNPANNSFIVSSYKTRYEDLYGRIVNSSNQIAVRGTSYDRAASVVSMGQISANVIQTTIERNSLVYTSGYNSGVTIDDQGITIENTFPYENGVTGQLLLRGGSILLSNRVDEFGNRIFESALTPEGINLRYGLIGTIDTSRINLFSGDQTRFVWKGEGLFAYATAPDGFGTDFSKYVRLNEDGLLFTYDDGATPVIHLAWNGLFINDPNGSLSLNPTDGLIISTIDGAVNLTSRYGLRIYDNASPKNLRVWLGQYSSGNYGLNIYGEGGKSILRTNYVGGNANLWMNGELAIGPYESNPIVGLRGSLNPILTDDQIIDNDLIPEYVTLDQYKDNISKRIFAGPNMDTTFESLNLALPAFTVLHDGTMFASQAIVRGQVFASGGNFSGDIFASAGHFTGIVNMEGGSITGNLNITTGGLYFDGKNSGFGTINFEQSTDYATLWQGGRLNNDGELISAPFYYSPQRGLYINGDIDVQSGNIQDRLYVREGESGIATMNEPTVDFEDRRVVLWTGANTEPTLNIDTNSMGYFFVTRDGELFAKSATLDGNMNIRSGRINGELEIYNDADPSIRTIISNSLNTQMLSVTITDGNDIKNPFHITQTGKVYAQDLTLDGKLFVQGNTHLTGSLFIDNQSSIQSTNFVSGFRGWFVGNMNGVDYAEFTNVKIRGELTSSVFEYEAVSAVGGELWIRPSIITTSDSAPNMEGIVTIISSASSLQRFTGGQNVLVQSIIKLNDGNYEYPSFTGQIVSINNNILTMRLPENLSDTILLNNVDLVCAGTSIISELNAMNDVGIKLSAIDSFGPFIDIYDRTSPLVRLGNLRGVTDSLFGTLEGYGLYASDAYITGKLYLPNAGITNAGVTGESIRIWAGSSPEDMESAPFRVTHDGNLYAERGVFTGTIEASGGSLFSGAIHLLGILLDRDDPSDQFFVGYTDTPTSDDDYVIRVNKDGLSIFEGGFFIYSDYADGWRGETKYQDASYHIAPYGGSVFNRYPYVSVNDSGMRLIARKGHFFDIEKDYSYKSTRIDKGRIEFSSGNVAAITPFLEAEEISFNREHFGSLGINGNHVELAGSNLVIAGDNTSIRLENEITMRGDIDNSEGIKAQFGWCLIRRASIMVDGQTKNVVEFYHNG